MLVNVNLMGDGPGPSERVVSLRTRGGESEEVIVSVHDLEGHRIDVGGPLAYENSHYLIELPREASSGKWRVWVPESETNKIMSSQAAE